VGVVNCSDWGLQYGSVRYTESLAEAGIEPSLDSVGAPTITRLAETIKDL
jgi:transposase InsO family protein